MSNYYVSYYEEHFCEILYTEFGPVVQEMPFKDISNLELWQPFSSAEWNHLCNFIEGIMRNFLRNYFEFGSGDVVQRSGTICTVLVEGIMRNISVKVFDF